MLARIRKSMEEKDQGFTLIELLVVMIIIGILAAIAIPVFLSQRQKARDTATKADVSTVGKEIASYYVDGTEALTIAVAGQTATITPATDPAFTVKVSSGTIANGAITYAGGGLANADGWCVSLTNPSGDKKAFKYSAAGGLVAGSCP